MRSRILTARAQAPSASIREIARRTGASQTYAQAVLGKRPKKPVPDTAFADAMKRAAYRYDPRLSFPERTCTENPSHMKSRHSGFVPSVSSIEELI